MQKVISNFIEYLQSGKTSSKNTLMSYERDLNKVSAFFASKGITDVKALSSKDLEDYIESLRNAGMSPATISRNIASLKAFNHYLLAKSVTDKDIAGKLHAPKIEKKAPVILTSKELNLLLEQPSGDSDKEIRDKAMLELLCATGIRVSELITIKLPDLNLKDSQITISEFGKKRVIPFGSKAKASLSRYLDEVRNKMIAESGEEYLFVNCSGETMSRQGFWKIIKLYAKRAGIKAEITPRTLRNSFKAQSL